MPRNFAGTSSKNIQRVVREVTMTWSGVGISFNLLDFN